jgi:PPOX class probable F420-dependent enzyme
MTDDEIKAFLAEGTRTGKVATTRADGRPHVAPIWFLVDDETPGEPWSLVFMTGADSVKGKSLARDPRLTLVVDLEEPPYSFAMVEGVAELSDDLEHMLPYSIELGRRYVGDEQAEAFGRRNAAPGELLVRLRPTKVVALADLIGE